MLQALQHGCRFPVVGKLAGHRHGDFRLWLNYQFCLLVCSLPLLRGVAEPERHLLLALSLSSLLLCLDELLEDALERRLGDFKRFERLELAEFDEQVCFGQHVHFLRDVFLNLDLVAAELLVFEVGQHVDADDPAVEQELIECLQQLVMHVVPVPEVFRRQHTRLGLQLFRAKHSLRLDLSRQVR